MTKEEIKFYQSQQKRIEDSYRFKIEVLEDQLKIREDEIYSLRHENAQLKEQIKLLQDGLTGEEEAYLDR